tara:strand:+ start:69 stop:563 length:495 start_codon:yes stop_codon:yes gene_type:complete
MTVIKVEDNFFDPKEFEKFQLSMYNLSWKLAWIDDPEKNDMSLMEPNNFQLYCDLLNSPDFNILNPLLKKMDVRSLLRIKSNLRFKTSSKLSTNFHTDFSVPRYDGLTTSIYYINTNNGYTEFEDSTKIESVANRLISFPYDLKHRGVTCTDEPFRMVINFNYF